ncbi:MAG TPA: hypothetical protein VF039_13460 [Longimicrobiales bacterium]
MVFLKRRTPTAFVIGLCLAASGCAPESPSAVEDLVLAPQLDHEPFYHAEGEILGRVFAGLGVGTTRTDLWVTLDQIKGGIPSSEYNPVMWVNPGGWAVGDAYEFWWSDINAGHDNSVKYNHCSGTYSQRMEEVHVPHGDEIPDPAGETEKHCVRAGGVFEFALWQGTARSGTPLRRFNVDYLAILNPTIWVDHPDGRYAVMSAPIGEWFDLHISTVLNPTGNEWDNPILCIDNAGTALGAEDGAMNDPAQCPPVLAANVTGYPNDFIRFSAAMSTHSASTTATYSKTESPLARLWFRRVSTGETKSTNFFTYAGENYLVRTIRFADLFPFEPTGTFEVSLELMRPDEQPLTSRPTTALRMVQILTPPQPPTVSSIVITPSPILVDPDGGTGVTATAYDQYGNVMAPVWYTWRIANTAIAIAGGTAPSTHVCGRAAGTTTLRATAPNGVYATATVTVPKGPYSCY